MACSTERPYRSQPWAQQRGVDSTQVRDGSDDSAHVQGAEARCTWLKYPRVSYTDLDNLICKKSEEEVHSKAEGGEHSEEACTPTCHQ